MEYTDLEGVIEALNKSGNWPAAYTLCELRKALPDLCAIRDNWGKIKYCSKAMTSEADHIEMESCHSCDGSPLHVWVFSVLEKEGKQTRVYSDPPCYVVADQNGGGFGEIPREGWEELLVQHGVARYVINKVREHLSHHPPISYLEAEIEDLGRSDS